MFAACAGDCHREAALQQWEAAEAAESEEAVILSGADSEIPPGEMDMSVPQMSRLYHLSDIESRPYYPVRRSRLWGKEVKWEMGRWRWRACLNFAMVDATTRSRSNSSGENKIQVWGKPVRGPREEASR